nr:uncharacterized protein LOC131751290 [Kogia breviceps]
MSPGLPPHLPARALFTSLSFWKTGSWLPMLPRRLPRCVWHPWRWGADQGLQPPCHTLRSRMPASVWRFKPAAAPGPGRFSVTQQVRVPAPSACALGSDSCESPACLLICVNQTTCEESSCERGFAGSWASSVGTLARDGLRGPPAPALWSPPPPPPPGPFPAVVIGLSLLFAGFLLVILRPRERVTLPRMLTVPGRATASSLSQNDFSTRLFEKIPRKKGLIEKSCFMYNWITLLYT